MDEVKVVTAIKWPTILKGGALKTKYKYIRFMSLGDTGKTSRWSIHNNRSQAFLGEIKWYSAWRQYCFFTTMDAVFNDSCMRDILDFIGQLSAARIVERPRAGLQQAKVSITDEIDYEAGMYR